MNNQVSDIVVLDRKDYDKIIEDKNKFYLENETLKNEMEIYKNYTINSLLEDEEYMLDHIEEYSLSDYHCLKLIEKFLELGITDIDSIIKIIKNFKENKEINNE